MRDDDIGENVLTWDDDLQVWSATVLCAQADWFSDGCCSRVRRVSIQRLDDGVVAYANFSALVRVAREVMPAVISDGSMCFA